MIQDFKKEPTKGNEARITELYDAIKDLYTESDTHKTIDPEVRQKFLDLYEDHDLISIEHFLEKRAEEKAAAKPTIEETRETAKDNIIGILEQEKFYYSEGRLSPDDIDGLRKNITTLGHTFHGKAPGELLDSINYVIKKEGIKTTPRLRLALIGLQSQLRESMLANHTILAKVSIETPILNSTVTDFVVLSKHGRDNSPHSSVGTYTTDLQERLNALELTDYNGNPLVVDGDYGGKTESAVYKLQDEYGLKRGAFGPDSLAALELKEAEKALTELTPENRNDVFTITSLDGSVNDISRQEYAIQQFQQAIEAFENTQLKSLANSGVLKGKFESSVNALNDDIENTLNASEGMQAKVQITRVNSIIAHKIDM